MSNYKISRLSCIVLCLLLGVLPIDRGRCCPERLVLTSEDAFEGVANCGHTALTVTYYDKAGNEMLWEKIS